MNFIDQIKPYAKFVVAILGAALSAASTTFPDNTVVKDWGPIVLSIATAIAVFATPNKDPLALRQRESVQPPNA